MGHAASAETARERSCRIGGIRQDHAPWGPAGGLWCRLRAVLYCASNCEVRWAVARARAGGWGASMGAAQQRARFGGVCCDWRAYFWIVRRVRPCWAACCQRARGWDRTGQVKIFCSGWASFRPRGERQRVVLIFRLAIQRAGSGLLVRALALGGIGVQLPRACESRAFDYAFRCSF
jgi:hypothetical protein